MGAGRVPSERALFVLFVASGCESTRVVTRTVTQVETVTVTVPVDTDLDEGRYEAPLVELAELTGIGGAIGPGGSTAYPRMHTSELRYRAGAPLTSGARPAQLASCSNTFTLYEVDNPSRPSMLAQGWTFDQRDTDLNGDGVLEEGVDEIHSGVRRPGCHHLVFDDLEPDYVWVTNHGSQVTGDSFLGGINLGEVVPAKKDEVYGVAPRLLAMQYEPETTFEGLDSENGLLYVARHDRGLGVYRRKVDSGQLERVGEHFGSLRNTFGVLVSGTTAYVADGALGVVVLDVSDPLAITEVGAVPVPGTATDLALDGTWLYVAAGSGGFSVVDVSAPSAPALVSTVSGSGTVVAVEHDAGRLFVAAWTDARVYDVSDPAAPRFIGAVREEEAVDFGDSDSLRPESADRVLAVEGTGDVLYDGLWTTPRTYQVHPERTAPYLVLPETVQQLTIPGDLAPGESASISLEIRNDGNEVLTLADAWASAPAFQLSPSQLTVAPGASATVQLTFTASPIPAATDASATETAPPEEVSTFYLRTDDPTQPLRAGFVIGNPAGLAVGDRFPETLASLPDGTSWSYGADAAGAPALISYWATFCPVCSAELPDIETAFWAPYRDQGLRVVALNPDDDEALDPQRVWDFAAFLGVTFPVGIDEGTTYDELQATTSGTSPYPVDLLVDREGFIRYVAREYDPDAMRPVVEALLAER
jgi:peroxiredoxin